MDTATAAVPAHLHPAACWICGGAKHSPTITHVYVSNADALPEAFGPSRAVGYPSGASTPEAAYVDQHRPR